jgi:hypothetical protein
VHRWLSPLVAFVGAVGATAIYLAALLAGVILLIRPDDPAGQDGRFVFVCSLPLLLFAAGVFWWTFGWLMDRLGPPAS